MGRLASSKALARQRNLYRKLGFPQGIQGFANISGTSRQTVCSDPPGRFYHQLRSRGMKTWNIPRKGLSKARDH